MGGPSLCRRTDFRLLDIQGSDAQMKRKAEDVMKRIFSAHLQRETPAEMTQEKPPDAVNRNSQHPNRTDPPKLPEPQGVAAKPVNTAEDAVTNGSGDCGSPPSVKLEVSGQQVCLVFTKVGNSR